MTRKRRRDRHDRIEIDEDCAWVMRCPDTDCSYRASTEPDDNYAKPQTNDPWAYLHEILIHHLKRVHRLREEVAFKRSWEAEWSRPKMTRMEIFCRDHKIATALDDGMSIEWIQAEYLVNPRQIYMSCKRLDRLDLLPITIPSPELRNYSASRGPARKPRPGSCSSEDPKTGEG